MRFVLENIGKVRMADVSLNGLTVITGENDSGKSTVGKLLFSTVKSLSNTDIQSDSQRQLLLEKYVSSLYNRLPRKVSLSGERKGVFFTTQPRRAVWDLLSGDSHQIEELLWKWLDEINSLEDLTPRTKTLMIQDVRNIRACLMGANNREAAVASEIQYFIESEFMNRICSEQSGDSFVELYMGDQEGPRLSYSIHSEVVREKDVRLFEGEYLQDATYVESPLYAHILDVLSRSGNYRETEDKRYFRSMVPIHIKDLANKLSAMRYRREVPSLSSMPLSELVVRLGSIVEGHFAFDEASRDLYFFRGESHFSPINVASGIKSFGVIQMLLETNAINENKILIWDEPENHLHPQWQVEFASVLVELAKAGIPIVISTHSPYFIQGVRYFSVRQDLEKFVNYYFADVKADGLSVLEDVTDDLNRVFVKLAEPLNRIMNLNGSRKR